MRVQLFGVRGSRPATGAQFVRFGGNTSCVALSHDGERPTLILDAGTGLSSFSTEPGAAAFEGSILLSHLHWDHVYGLPFFAAGDRPDSRVQLYMPAQGNAEDVLAEVMRPPHFPIRPSGLRGQWSFRGLDEGRTDIEGFDVLAVEIPHKGGRTFGYRITSGARTIAYLPDHGPVEWGEGADGNGVIHEAALTLVADADLVLHDAQHTAAEFPAVRHFGHSTIDYAIALARQAGVRRLVLFHHDPSRTDDQLDELQCQVAPSASGDKAVDAVTTGAVTMAIDVAREGAVYDLS